ncbi:MAG: hypothetical protein FWC21_00775 [Treponema sp.]|nr:hypothetical protein [Treponema sp.]
MKNKWKGIVRFNPADNFINLHNALPGVDVTWTRYFFPSLGGSIEININFGWGVLPAAEISLLSGVEYIPIGPVNKEKNGLFLDAKIGFSVFILNEIKFFFIAKTNAGYQLITGKGFVFTPGIGVIYNSRNGFGLNLMFDIGFAYKYKKIKT